MKAAFSNSAYVMILLSTLVVGAKGQDSQSPSSSQPAGAAQPQNEPAQPSQNAPQQESPKEQQQTQPPAQAPNAVPPQSEPTGQAAPDQGQSKEQRTEQPAPAAQAPPDQTSHPKPHPTAKSKSTRKKRTTSSKAQSTDPSGKVVVRNGGLRESTNQISPGGNDQQAQSQRNVTSQLLATTDANLKKVSGQQLTPAQQSMLDQVNAYVRQSKAASDAGDIPRAHTLAVKAQLLSNELARK